MQLQAVDGAAPRLPEQNASSIGITALQEAEGRWPGTGGALEVGGNGDGIGL